VASRWTAADVAATGLPVSRTSPSGLARASTCAHAPLPTRSPACGQVRARPRPQAPTRTRARTPNRWEQSYYEEVLAPRIAAGEILAAHYEALTLRIGRCRYTIRVAHRYLRRLLGVRAFTPHTGIRIRAIIGIAADEADRVTVSREPWCDLVHPLVDAGVTKADETRLLREHGWPVPEKSACVYCPYHGDDYWRALRTRHPEDFERACQADEAMRTVSGARAQMFVHRSRRPLRQVQFGDAPGAFGNDCSGLCGA